MKPHIQQFGNANIPYDKFFTREEMLQVKAAAPWWLKPVIQFAFQTSWRRREVTDLKWSEVDFEARAIMLEGRRTKTGQNRPIFMDDNLMSILIAQRNAQAESGIVVPYVFHRFNRNETKGVPQPIKQFQSTWKTTMKNAGLEYRKFECFRQSGIREMLRTGYDQWTTMSVSGHKTPSMLQRYNIVDLEDQRRAAERRQEAIERHQKANGEGVTHTRHNNVINLKKNKSD